MWLYMYCKNCGAELENPNQRFCQECGAEISISEQLTQAEQKVDVSQYAIPPTTLSPISQPIYGTSTPSSEISMKYGVTLPNSKKSLGFGLPSFLIAIIALLVVPVFAFLPLIYPYGYNPPYSFSVSIPFVVGIHGLGLLFGILGVVFGTKARNLEPDNGIGKAGNVFGIFGIILNSLGLITALAIGSIPFGMYFY